MYSALAIAIVASATSIFVSALTATMTFVQHRRINAIETQKLHVAQNDARERARLDYEYQARRRLYENWEPAFFQFSQKANFAIARMRRLADSSIWPELAQGEPESLNIKRASLPLGRYEVLASLYDIYCPLVHIRAMTNRLTLFDLSLEPTIRFQQFLSSCVYQVLQHDALMASFAPAQPYTPFVDDWRTRREETPQQYWWQGLTMGRLENFLDFLTDANAETPAPVSFGQFERSYLAIYDDVDETHKKDLAAAANPVFRFRPRDRPVYCRLLLSQARLYWALEQTRRRDFAIPLSAPEWKKLLDMPDAPFAKSTLADDGLDGAELMSAADEYLHRTVISAWTGVGV